MSLETGAFKSYLHQMKTLLSMLEDYEREAVNKTVDRHLARCKKNTQAGTSPDSPTLRNAWDRSGVLRVQGSFLAEVFNTARYAPYYEFGHRQTPGRLVFVELRPGAELYGKPAKQVKKGRNAGKWGIIIRLKKPYVPGAFVMTDSEKKAQRELDAAVKGLEAIIRKGLG